MAIAWATDLHLDSVELSDVNRFCARVRQSGANSLLISGDISDANSVVDWLEYLELQLEVPIFFVLGNHDYYGSDIDSVERKVSRVGKGRLFYVPQHGPVPLSDRVTLVGHGGWGDCRIGDVDEFAILTDYFAIKDLRDTVNLEEVRAGHFARSSLRAKLGELGDTAAELLAPQLFEAARTAESVVVLTHVPPFRESCWHNGAISDGPWLPGFTCKAVGDLILAVARAHTDISYTVLCGHTHGHGVAHLLPNVEAVTGHGDYGLLCFSMIQFDGARVIVQGLSE